MNVTQHMADQNGRQLSKTKSDVEKLWSKGLSKNEFFWKPVFSVKQQSGFLVL